MVLNKGTLNKMRIFRHFDHKHADLFILDLYKCLDVRTFPEFSTIAMQGEPQDGLYIVHQGVAQVSIVPPVEGENGEQTVAARSSETFATVSQTFVAFTRLCHLRYVPLRAVFDMWDFCLCMLLSCCLMFLILIDSSLAAPPDSRFRNRHRKRAPT